MRLLKRRADPVAVLDRLDLRDQWRLSRPAVLIPRLWKVLRAYGPTTTRYDLLLRQYEEILQRHAVPATFPVTAVTLRRHPHIMRRLADSRIELAVHGLTHVDHSKLDFESQVRVMAEAMHIFRESGFAPEGFRCPYLWCNEHTPRAAHQAGFTYVSNQVFLWAEFDQRSIRNLYRTRENQGRSFLPFTSGGVIEMPVAVPDDFLLADRLGLPGEEISRIWSSLLEDVTAKGGMLVLQLHPELISRCSEPLDRLLRDAQAAGDVWISTLGEVARWWRSRREFSVRVTSENEEILLTVHVPSRGVAMISDGHRFDSHRTEKAGIRLGHGTHSLSTRTVPLVAVPIDTSDEVILALKERGYLCHRTREPSLHAARLTAEQLREGAVDDWIRGIEATAPPLLRFLPWPEGKHSAFCITGDIDAVTLWDQARRLAAR